MNDIIHYINSYYMHARLASMPQINEWLRGGTEEGEGKAAANELAGCAQVSIEIWAE